MQRTLAAGWKNVTAAVHQEDGTIVCQLWFIGRASHSSFMPDGKTIVSASDVLITTGGDGVYGADLVKHPFETPRPLTVAEVEGIVEDYGAAAANAAAAGFDGVEIHAANGYLVDQFLQTCSNKRDDKYGGDDERRYQFLKEIIERVMQEFPVSRIGVRISPNGVFNGMGAPNNNEYFKWVTQKLSAYGLAYLSVMDGLGFGYHELAPPVELKDLRPLFVGGLFGNVGYDGATANARIAEGAADAIIFGRPFIANPDLPMRLTHGWPLAESDVARWYTANAEMKANPQDGYTTYPNYVEVEA